MIRRVELDKHPHRVKSKKRNRASIYLLVSLLFHACLILVGYVSGLLTLGTATDEWEQQKDSQLVFELVEIPDHIPRAEPDAETNLVSDRDARAADLNPEEFDNKSGPYVAGQFEVEPHEQQSGEKSAADQKAMAGRNEEEPIGDLGRLDGGRDYVAGMKAGQQPSAPPRAPGFKNPLSSSDNHGAISFNTYNWDFAPYMLAMKKKIEGHMYPPYAFTHMGMVSGTNIIRFTVLPDGYLKGIELLGSDAHSSLDRTSMRAIELSVPFLPLPEGFPEDYLVVTAHFAYIVDR